MKQIKTFLPVLAMAVLCTAFNSCDDKGQLVAGMVPYSGLVMNKQSLEMFEAATTSLTAMLLSPSESSNYTVYWSSSNPGVATVSSTGMVTAIKSGTCTITATCEGHTATCSITVKPFVPQYVDLGLSVKWATCNVGAFSPEEYGDYFAWGETSPKTNYSWSTYKYCNGSDETLTKYCTSSSYGTVDNKTILDLTDDAARANWGGSWRMPTKAEFSELSNSSNCTWTWYASGNTEFNGVAGYKVISKKSGYVGNYIFLPAAGYRSNTYLHYAGSEGNYWSSLLGMSSPWFLDFYSGGRNTYSSVYRYCGQSVRPVCPVAVTGITLSSQSLEIAEYTTATLSATLSPSRASGYTVTWSSSNPGVATVSSTGMVTAIKSGTCTITATCEDLSATCSITVEPFVPQYIDLGLSVKWATCNLGAFSPEGYGDYFAWGETEPLYQPGYAQSGSPLWKSGKSAGYDWSTYKYCNGSSLTMTKYCTSSSCGTVDNKTVLDLTDDAARANWGGNWRMPTEAEFDELSNSSNCTWTWYASGNTEFNGVAGCKVISKKSGYEGNWIFLPAAGYRGDSYLYNAGGGGDYWSSSLYTGYPNSAWSLGFCLGDRGTSDYHRCSGQSVRPVCL